MSNAAAYHPPLSVQVLISAIFGDEKGNDAPPIAEPVGSPILPEEYGFTIVENCGVSEDYPRRSFSVTTVGENSRVVGIHIPDVPRLAREYMKNHASLRSHARGRGGWDGRTGPGLRGRMLDATACVLLLCPDRGTAWADRRRCLLDAAEKARDVRRYWTGRCGRELDLLNLIVTRSSKAPTSWAHRKWISEKFIRIRDDGVRTHPENWEKVLMWAKTEIGTCISVAEKFPKNYYAWTHRLYVVRTLAQLIAPEVRPETSPCTFVADGGENGKVVTGGPNLHVRNSNGHRHESHGSVRNVLMGEVRSTDPWLRRHVGDHSAVHYAAEVMGLLLELGCVVGSGDATEESDDVLALQMILDAFEENRILLNAYPTHEVLWRYRRLCVLLMLRAAGETVGSATPLKVLHTTQGTREMTNEICTRIGWNIENCTLKSALGEYFKREIEMTLDVHAKESNKYPPIPRLESTHTRSDAYHSLSYASWILFHMKKLYYIENDAKKFHMYYETVHSCLKNNSSTVHNLWRGKLNISES